VRTNPNTDTLAYSTSLQEHLSSKIAEQLELLNVGARERVIYGVSTGTLDDGIAKAFEQGTPLVTKRIQSLHWLQDNGFRTFGMLCPSLPIPGGDYTQMANEMASAIRADRCEHTWAEVINVRGDSMTRTVAALNAAGFHSHANELAHVSGDAEAWEQYSRDTFEAHVPNYAPNKLRFLQYVTARTKTFWQGREKDGAILL